MAFTPILFDLDGTLTDSGPGIMAATRHALSKLGRPALHDDQLRAFIGPPLVDSFSAIAGMDELESAQALAAYREHYTDRGIFQNSVYPGIPQALQALKDAGRTLAVATSKPTVFATRILDHFDLASYFTVVVGAHMDGRRNAKSEVVAEVMRRLGPPIAPDEAVMIGDRAQDVRGSSAHGIDCIGALWGYGTAEELTGAGARWLAASPADLPKILLC